MHLLDPNTPLDQFLSAEPELRRLFDQLGLDGCGAESQSLAEVCQRHDLHPPTVLRLLPILQAMKPPRQEVSLELLTLRELCDHLEHTQQMTLREALAQLDRLTLAAAEQQGSEHPRLWEIRNAFVAFREQFVAHSREEAEEVFPLIRQLTSAEDGRRPSRSALKSRLAGMIDEHNQADEALAELRALASDEGWRATCPAHLRTIPAAIVRLEQTFHEQIYRENQVLFPRALAIGGSA